MLEKLEPTAPHACTKPMDAPFVVSAEKSQASAIINGLALPVRNPATPSATITEVVECTPNKEIMDAPIPVETIRKVFLRPNRSEIAPTRGDAAKPAILKIAKANAPV